MGVSGRLVPFVQHVSGAGELAHVEFTLASGQTSGDGPSTARTAELLSRQLGVAGDSGVLLTMPCTHALEVAALLVRVGAGTTS